MAFMETHGAFLSAASSGEDFPHQMAERGEGRPGGAQGVPVLCAARVSRNEGMEVSEQEHGEDERGFQRGLSGNFSNDFSK